MKALRLHAAGELRLHDEPEPEPADGDVVVDVAAVGLCGSDRHWLVEGGIGDAALDRPLVLGHEFAGTIASGPRAGERVAIDPAVPCESCPVCAAGLAHLCPNLRFAGHGVTDGALRSRLAWPARLAHPLPDSIDDAAATLLEPLGVALHALDLGKLRPGSSTAVVGCGPLGLLLVQALAAAGAEPLVATDPLPHRAAAASALGVPHAVDPGELADVPPPGGMGVDVVFEAAGTDDAVADAIALVRPGGRVVLVGIPDGDRTTFVASAARRKGLTMLLCRRMTADDLPRAIALVAQGGLELPDLVSERHRLDDWRPAFEGLVTRRGLKVVVEP